MSTSWFSKFSALCISADNIDHQLLLHLAALCFFFFPNAGMCGHVESVDLCIISLLITLIDNLFAPWQARHSAHRVISESIFVLCIGLCFISYMLIVFFVLFPRLFLCFLFLFVLFIFFAKYTCLYTVHLLWPSCWNCSLVYNKQPQCVLPSLLVKHMNSAQHPWTSVEQASLAVGILSLRK